jgi:cell division protein ZipA
MLRQPMRRQPNSPLRAPRSAGVIATSSTRSSPCTSPRAGQTLRGPDIVVAAEKAGLSYGYMNIFHRLGDGRSEGSPIFSVANIKKPGSFEMHEIQAMETPAIAFFLTLPAPIPALDAWEKMLPTAQRMAELLDGVVLDESRNALGRQRIAHLRDELRAYDRQHEAPPISKNTRW